ncbi:hypothetical protein F7725_016656 [Dissostichus mawsoni]|uniref:Uncharacterized protein n=1 Tax=Dissostichus mawsoni TaxID=36200 RepID=A0A7J5Z341_DISMA|nr:hypothetical protein F7725_016656 [Dissostichus mawsoni]
MAAVRKLRLSKELAAQNQAAINLPPQQKDAGESCEKRRLMGKGAAPLSEQPTMRTALPIKRQHLALKHCAVKPKSVQRGSRTQGEDVGAAGPGHMVLLDGLVESGLAQQQEAQANPHGQQPGHETTFVTIP